MRTINDPRQKLMFDPFLDILSPLAYKTLRDGWQQLFRDALLEIMPVDAVKQHFSAECGPPTKELHSAAALIFIMEFMDWTTEDAARAYMFNTDLHYALNLRPELQSMSSRTVERYKRLMIEDELAAQVMDSVTTLLVKKLRLNVEKQRLDSTHIESNMAQFGRTRMMGVAVKRFLTQLKRHDLVSYDQLEKELRERYVRSSHQLFGDAKKDSESHRLLRDQVAQDMYELIKRFEDDPNHNTRSTYRMLCTIFEQQCEVTSGKITVKTHPGGDTVQNSSDPDATRDGKKGPGYQLQLAETCSEENDVQLITVAIPQTASEHDANAIETVIDALKQNDMVPKEMSADTAYGGDDNVQRCETEGIELVSPTPGKKPEDVYAINSDDFVIDEETGECTSCPCGSKPLETRRNDAKEETVVVFSGTDCEECEHAASCPAKLGRDGNYTVRFTDKQRRLDARRREEDTDVFRERYRIRAGIEATNSIVKRVTGLARLRVRGRPSVFHSSVSKILGHNIFQAVRGLVMRRRSQKRLALA